ncbi:nuclear fragile X mental retardation protein interacting protein 1 [Chamberlinius hualienensis]
MYNQSRSNTTYTNFWQNGKMAEDEGRNFTRASLNASREYHKYNRPPPAFNGKQNSFKGKKFFKKGDYRNHCKTCDWSFDTKEAYNEHLQSHVKCPDETCKFEAHKDIIEFHYKIEHIANFADRLKRLETPEEIDKWINERKRNFPTARRVEEKKEQKSEKIARGELLETQNFGKFKNKQNRSNKHHAQRLKNAVEPNSSEVTVPAPAQPRPKAQKRKRKRLTKPRKFIRKDYESSEDETVHPIWGTKRFQGVPITEENLEEGEITDSDSDVNQKLDGVKSSSNALQMLGQCYNSSSDGETKVEEEKIVKELPIHKEPTEINVNNATNNNKQMMKISNKQQQFGKRKNRPNLLEMLLAPDIRHERNVILQCNRYIINNNFLN